MAPRRFLSTSLVLFAATLAAKSSAIDFGTENDGTQTAGTVAPGGAMSFPTANKGANGFGDFNGPSHWSSTAAPDGKGGWSQPTSDTPMVWQAGSGQGWTPPMTPSGQSSGGWSQPISTDSPSVMTPTNDESSGYDDQLDCSGSSESDWDEMDLECSGSDEEVDSNNDFSLECSGSDEEEPSESTPTTETSSFPPTPPSSVQNDEGTSFSTPAPPSMEENLTPSTDTVETTASSSNTAMQGGSDVTQADPEGSSGATKTSTSTGEHASFGTVTSKSGECVVGNPDKYISTADLNWVWKNRMGENATGNHNWIFDHIVANKGSLSYCVRWDSTEKLSKKLASKFQAMLERQYAAWNKWLIGYGCWPYNEIKINMVGIAVKEASQLDWKDDSVGKIYVGDLDAEGAPQCPQPCYRFFDNAPKTWTDTSACEGKPFDLTLRPKQGLEGGLGYDYGQEVNLENMVKTIDDEELTIVSHEIGHGFGLPDFYEEAEKPNKDFPPALMMAGSAMSVTDSDGWMLRRIYENIMDRYDFK